MPTQKRGAKINMNSKLSFEQVIRILKRKTAIPGDGYSYKQIEEAFDIAIREVGKQIPKYVKNYGTLSSRYNPNVCPTCGANLGGECDDGIYKNPCYKCCPECGQKLRCAIVI